MDEKKLLPFDLAKALKGAKVVTRDGREVRNLRKCLEPYKKSRIEGHVSDIVSLMSWWNNGRYLYSQDDSCNDLFLLDETGYDSLPVDPYPKPIHDFDGVDVDKYLEIVRTGEGNLDDCLTYEEKPFDLDTAKKHPEWVYTRDGRKVRIICDNAKVMNFDVAYPIIVLIYSSHYQEEVCETYTIDGRSWHDAKGDEYDDLILRVPKPKKRKVVKYANYSLDTRTVSNIFFDTPEKAAENSIFDRPTVVAKIEWEEEVCGTSSSK